MGYRQHLIASPCILVQSPDSSNAYAAISDVE
jgi:hypothetical protein